MGGNATGTIKATGKTVTAEKIPLKEIGRTEFTNKFIQVFKELNKIYKKANKELLWVDEGKIISGELFNGSTSYIFDSSIADDDILKHKEFAGDIDIIVPENTKEAVWEMLDKLEDKEVIPGVTYNGSNKPTIKSIGEQINCVFVATFGEAKIAVQVDFEFLEVDDKGTPSEWAKFSHNSSFDDAKISIKSVHHKFLLQSIIGGASVRDDIVIVTPSSTPEKLRFKKMKDLPRMLKFSVGRGIRNAYELMHDIDGNVIQQDGKDVYREIPTKSSEYVTVVSNIYKLAFGRLEDNEADVKKFGSFAGMIELMDKYLDKKQIEASFDRYVEKLFGTKGLRAQELESHDQKLDYQVKIAGYEYFIKELKVKDKFRKQIDLYYSEWKGRKGENMVSTIIKNVISERSETCIEEYIEEFIEPRDRKEFDLMESFDFMGDYQPDDCKDCPEVLESEGLDTGLNTDNVDQVFDDVMDKMFLVMYELSKDMEDCDPYEYIQTLPDENNDLDDMSAMLDMFIEKSGFAKKISPVLTK